MVDVALIFGIVVVAVSFIFFFAILINIIIKKRKLKNEPHSRFKEIKVLTFKDTSKEWGSKDQILTSHISQESFPIRGFFFLIGLGFTWIAVIVLSIWLIAIGGFYDDSWSAILISIIVVLLGFNILPLIVWGYRYFARVFAKGFAMVVLALSITGALRGQGIVEPIINYDFLIARILMGLLGFLLPLIYIFMTIFEMLMEKNEIEKEKRSLLLVSNFFEKNKELKEILDSGDKERLAKFEKQLIQEKKKEAENLQKRNENQGSKIEDTSQDNKE